uniref:Uncharacterized protein n=1 Tax=Colletotrichum gloeosporioides partitivirus 1 TaxID=2603562 RepID=A0A5B9BH35_9VIRU|nr:hypothetical protein [Colletotrichum gloeosporioides partitivirus 1]
MRPKKVKEKSTPSAVFPCDEPVIEFKPGAFAPVYEIVSYDDFVTSLPDTSFGSKPQEDLENFDPQAFRQSVESFDVGFTRPDYEWFVDPALNTFGSFVQSVDLSTSVEHLCPLYASKEVTDFVCQHNASETANIVLLDEVSRSDCPDCVNFAATAVSSALACPCFVKVNRFERLVVENPQAVMNLALKHSCLDCSLCLSLGTEHRHGDNLRQPSGPLLSSQPTDNPPAFKTRMVDTVEVSRSFVALAFRYSDSFVYGYVDLKFNLRLPKFSLQRYHRPVRQKRLPVRKKPSAALPPDKPPRPSSKERAALS